MTHVNPSVYLYSHNVQFRLDYAVKFVLASAYAVKYDDLGIPSTSRNQLRELRACVPLRQSISYPVSNLGG